MRFAEFVRNSGSPVAYYPRLAIALGGVKEAVFVCQLLYWEGKQSDSERWIHKTLEEVKAETGLSRYEQDGVRRTLERKGILETWYDRLVHRLYFRIDLGRLSDCWEAEYPSSETAENTDVPSEWGKTTFGKTEPRPVPSLANVEKPLSYNRIENTAENTTTTTRAHESAGSDDSQVEAPSSSLAIVDKLVQDFGLSQKQRQKLAEYCPSLGEEYVRSKAEIVRAQPRRNAAGALLAALRDDWQPSIQSDTGASEKQARLAASRELAKRMGWEW